MATNRDLLKEAIADAKAVKEMAIANAKAALEEAFAPRLTSMLSAKLEEMEGMDEAEEEVEETYSGVEEGMDKEMEEAYDKADNMEEEMDLDELLAELEEGEDKEDIKEEEEVEAEETETEEVEGEEGEDEEIDLEEMSEDDLKSFIEDVIADMVAAGELEAGEEFEAEEGDEELEVEDETEEIMEGEDKEEVNEIDLNVSDMEALLAMLAGGVGIPLAVLASTYAKDGIEAVKRLVSSKKANMGEAEEVKEMSKEIKELKSELNEINLLNSKLLYVNKIFRSKNLTESQKSKVLAAFDKAESVNEVKLVFETISESLTTVKKEVVKENLSMASKPAGVARQPIMEIDPQVARWKKLAGL